MGDDKVSVDLGAVEETLLIPLLGRAIATQRRDGLIDDARAVEIVETLDYDFSKWSARGVVGASLRTRIFDTYVEEFLEVHPKATVVELGCGLNTRFSRVDNGQVRWFDLDLPDVIALRRRFFGDEPRCTMLAASIIDTEWMGKVAPKEGPIMFVSEAVIIYLEAPQARRAFQQIGAHFDDFWMAVDTTSRSMLKRQAYGPMRKLPREGWFRWECNDPTEIEAWVPGLRLVQSKTFVDVDRDHLRHVPMPFPLGLLVRRAPQVARRLFSGYRFNLFQRAAGASSEALGQDPNHTKISSAGTAKQIS